MLNTARTTCLVGLVDLYQTELYQDSTNYHELEKSRLLMNFFVTINPCGGEVVTLPGACFDFLITYQAFTIYFNRLHDIETCKQEKMQLNMNLLKEGSN